MISLNNHLYLYRIAVEPAQPGWPVILAVNYSDPNSDGSDMIYVWSFPQQQDQSCTVRGRIYVHPCIGKVRLALRYIFILIEDSFFFFFVFR